MSEKIKTESEKLKEKLFYNMKNGAIRLKKSEVKKADDYCEGYKDFISANKTEREAVGYAVREAEKRGFRAFDKSVSYKTGDKVYINNRGKAVVLAVIGRQPLDRGVNIGVAHIDSPRLDLKQSPLYEDTELAFFKTHYYGGIKKYQWTTVPLALHGVVAKKDGTVVGVCVGEDENDPQFCVTDLLIHLSSEQMKKPVSKAIDAEKMNVIIGSRPISDEEGGDLVKLNIMKLLNEKYGIDESDFLSAELTMVPAGKARDIGFDRSLIGAYGNDDKVCAYPALTALLDCGVPERTSVCVLTDKEEIGSVGNSGLQSSYLKFFIADLARRQGLAARDVLSASSCLSADVSAAFDPSYPDVMEKKNASYLNYGVALCKFTGHGGKYDTNDASAEFTAKVRRLFDDNDVIWHMAELGKVDAGGGGTVAMYVSKLNVDTIDVGVPVLSMHSPFEIVSKIDVYSEYKAMLSFFKTFQ